MVPGTALFPCWSHFSNYSLDSNGRFQLFSAIMLAMFVINVYFTSRDKCLHLCLFHCPNLNSLGSNDSSVNHCHCYRTVLLLSLTLGNKDELQQAFLSGYQRHTIYSCPLCLSPCRLEVSVNRGLFQLKNGVQLIKMAYLITFHRSTQEFLDQRVKPEVFVQATSFLRNHLVSCECEVSFFAFIVYIFSYLQR